MSTPAQEERPKGWRALSLDERRTLSPVDRERAKLRDAEADRAAARRRLARVQHLATETDRKRDARRKILAGAVVLTWATKPRAPGAPALVIEDPARWLTELLDAGLDRATDREVFGLAPRPTGAEDGAISPTID